MSAVYIHYGIDRFDPVMFKEIRNREYFNKPSGGLWASDVKASFGWRDWCQEEDLIDWLGTSYFLFTLRDDANVIHIRSLDDVGKLERNGHFGDMYNVMVFPDFEWLLKSGVDAVELHLSDCQDLHTALYGWDCDSILILNKDIVVPYDEPKRVWED